MRGQVITSTALAAGATYTSQWFESGHPATGEGIYVTVSIYSDQDSAGNGIIIQETDDKNTTAMINPVRTTQSNAGTLFLDQVTIRRRFWRILFTCGGVAQSTFELAVNQFANAPLQFTSVTGALKVDVGTVDPSPASISAFLSTRMVELFEALLIEVRISNLITSEGLNMTSIIGDLDQLRVNREKFLNEQNENKVE